MKLTPRLQAVAALVPEGTVVADIGTDHGYIPVYLMVNRIARRVIATDANSFPLQSARETINLFNLADRITLRLGDGLSALAPDDEVDVLIVAGMGGNLITRILGQGLHQLETVRNLVLQPMSQAGEVRRWLAVNRWGLISEDLVQEGDRIYEVIGAGPESQSTFNLDSQDPLLEVGPLLVSCCHPLLPDLLQQRLATLARAAAGAQQSDSRQAQQRQVLLQQRTEFLEEVLQWVLKQRA